MTFSKVRMVRAEGGAAAFEQRVTANAVLSVRQPNLICAWNAKHLMWIACDIWIIQSHD